MEPYIGEIRQFGGNFAPQGWAFCNGQVQNISDNPALYQLIGTTYGGDGQNTFNLPNLQGRIPIHQGNNYTLGQMGGVENVTLTTNQLPVHNHPVLAAAAGGSDSPAGNSWGTASGSAQAYGTAPGSAAMNTAGISIAGGSQPHYNMHPYLAVSFIICLDTGIYPSQA